MCTRREGSDRLCTFHDSTSWNRSPRYTGGGCLVVHESIYSTSVVIPSQSFNIVR